jgi:hypothetical protein
MKISFLEEPELEFGAGRHVDIRFGLMNYGPLDFDSRVAPHEVNLGIIGSAESIEGVRLWLERCRKEIPAKRSKEDPEKQSNQPNLFPRFPGYSVEAGFRSSLVLDVSPGDLRIIQQYSSSEPSAIFKKRAFSA